MGDEKLHKETSQLIAGKEEKELWFSSLAANDSHSYNVNEAFAEFQRRTHRKKTARFLMPSFLYKAAAVALVVIACGLSFWMGGNRVQGQFADIVLEAPLGSKSKLTLPDGSLVWLNAGSRIAYSQGFGVNNRHLELSGEAYFEVTKNEDLPFDVKTRELNVTVLGTKFNFRNYEEDEEVIVNLMEGRVRLDNHIREMSEQYLSPEEKVVLRKSTGEMVISKAKLVGNTKEWTNDVLLFDEMCLRDIARELERSYNVTISIKNENLRDYRFYAVFNRREQTIRDVLDIMTRTGKVRYRAEGKSILLYDK